jgi:uncharacterized protein (TIGR02271 family)
MTHTLVAAFDTLTEAQAAKAQLLSHNIAEPDIEISSSELHASQGHSASAERKDTDNDSFGEKVSHFFGSLFGSDEDDKSNRYATAYPEAYRRGAALLTVTIKSDDQIANAESILERNGAIDIDERSAAWESESGRTHAGDVTGATSHIAGTHGAADHTEVVDRKLDSNLENGSTSIPVIEEDLRVGKREVNTGRVRVVSRVSERPVEETVNLHEEHAHIERRPVNRPVSTSDLDSFKPGSVEIRETAEEVVVEKAARVVEEVSVGKRGSDRQETVHDTVRRTDVDVENESGSHSRNEMLGENPNDPLRRR